jgi:glycosyltransferase involved in cell wall biosynthesis
MVVLQDTRIAPEAVARAAAWPTLIAGSTWNTRLLQAHGLPDVRCVIQGIDPTLFHPGPRLGAFGDRFLVFSGGKLERRKAQDLVIAAFARFAHTRPDALLVTAWQSPWPELARELDAGGVAAPVTLDDRGRLDVAAWAEANGVPARQVLDLGMVPNAQMPPILREMDVAVFPNRAEGGTNLVAMEAMACGVPAILSANTGHLDLIDRDNCYALRAQRSLPGQPAFGDVPGWSESDLDEIVAALEAAYEDRGDARGRGARGAATVGRLTWRRMADELKAIVLELS